MLSRQEELKERARVLLEQARRDAALKAGNKQLTNTIIPARNKQLNDVRNTGQYGSFYTVNIYRTCLCFCGVFTCASMCFENGSASSLGRIFLFHAQCPSAVMCRVPSVHLKRVFLLLLRPTDRCLRLHWKQRSGSTFFDWHCSF